MEVASLIDHYGELLTWNFGIEGLLIHEKSLYDYSRCSTY